MPNPVQLSYITLSHILSSGVQLTSLGPDGTNITQLPYTDNFDRANGVLGGKWSGTTWNITSNTARNVPATYGIDDISNGNFETGNPPTDWTDIASTLAAVSDERTGGSGTKSLSVINAGAANGFAKQVLDYPDGTWVRLRLWVRRVTGNPFYGLYESDDTKINTTGASSTSWGFKTLVSRLKGANCSVKLSVNSTILGDEARFDDVDVMPLTFSELCAFQKFPTSYVTATIDISGSSFGQAGVAACWDSISNPQNGILAHVKGGDITLEKCVNGVWSRVIWTAVTQVVGGTLKLEISSSSGNLLCKIYYEDVQIGGNQTISDATIIGNTLHGLFADDPNQPQILDNFTISAT